MNAILKKHLGLLALACFLTLTAVPPAAQAGWDDRSDELPGMDNNVGTYLAVGGALVGALLIWKLSSGGDDAEAPVVKEREESKPADDADPFATRAQLLDDISDSIDCKPILGIGSDGAVVGMSFGL